MRFARAKGSKASNERVAEEATSWGEMKQQLLEKNKQIEDTKKKQEADKQRESNYKAFLQDVEEEQNRDSKWADFSIDTTNNNDAEVKTKKKKKSFKIVSQKDEENVKLRKLDDIEEQNRDSKWTDFPTDTTNNNDAEVKTKKKKKSLKIVSQKDEENATLRNLDDTEELKMKVSNKNESKGVKRKLNKLDKSQVKPASEVGMDIMQKKKSKVKSKKMVDPANLSEADVQKIEKKKQRRLRQLEKKKLKKQQELNSEGAEQNTEKPVKPKKKIIKDNKKPERRKHPQDKMIINGKEIEIAYMDGFPIKKEDADRIHQLRRQMISKGLPRSEIKITLKLERRRAEKAFAREKKMVCFNCRKSGHNLSECPELGEQQLAESAGTGICFKCGSTEHTHFECKVVRGQEFKFAQCFICREQGHIARQCPDNARGMYPKGGACKVCGDVTHLKKDCPKYQAQQQQDQNVHLQIMDGDNPDSLGQSEEAIKINAPKHVNKIVKF